MSYDFDMIKIRKIGLISMELSMRYLLGLIMMFLGACQHGESLKVVQDQSSLLTSSIRDVDVLILGEKHDNRWHHLYQAEVIKNLAEQEILDAVYMEHLFASQEVILRADKPDTWPEKLKWNQSGWPDYKMFSPIFKVLAEKSIRVKGIGIPRTMIKGLYQNKDPELISTDMKGRIGLMEKLPASAHQRLIDTIRESHCGYIDTKHAQKMLPLQRYKDAYMASRLEVQGGKIAVFLVGAGHARKDFGVPYYIRKGSPSIRVQSVFLAEHGDKDEIEDGLFDLLVQLPAVKREDPCEKFKKSLKKLR